MKQSQNTVFIAGGGTAGHIYPGVALAQSLENNNFLHSDTKFKTFFQAQNIHFIGTRRGLEQKILSKTKYTLHFVNMVPFNVPSLLKKIISLFFFLPISTLQSIILLLKFKPLFVISLGGYVSAPANIACFILRKPLFLWEPNVYPGLANRLSCHWSRLNFVIFKEAAQILQSKKQKNKKIKDSESTNTVLSGLPLRKPFDDYYLRSQKNLSYQKEVVSDRSKGPIKLLVMGGSQGASAINDVILDFVKSHNWYDFSLHIKHQTGVRDYDKVKTFYDECSRTYSYDSFLPKKSSVKNQNFEGYVVNDFQKKRDKGISKGFLALEAFSFIENIFESYLWADLVISRAGLSSLFELAACEKMALLVPLPTAADNHQSKNAQALVAENKAMSVEQSQFTDSFLTNWLQSYKEQPDRFRKQAYNLRELYIPNAGDKILDLIFQNIDN